MISIHNNGDPKRPKGISKAIGEHAHAHSQLHQSRWLSACCSKERREKLRLQERPPKQQEKPMKAYLYNNELKGTSNDKK